MKSFTYTVNDEIGIHARPAGLLVKAAKGLSSKASMTFGDKSADMTKLFAIMGLCVKHGDTITVSVEGNGEDADAAALLLLLSKNL